MKKGTTICAVLTASAVLTLGSAFAAFAAEWTIEDGEWAYKNNSGEYVKDTWQTNGNHDYYLGKDGYMLRSTLLEVNGNYYYVNSSGAKVTNEWRQIENASWQSQTAEDTNWYYFDNNGRALRSKDGSSTVQTIGDKKYIFDEFGRMLTGWITDTAEMSTEQDAWQQAVYYADGEEGGGALITNGWLYATVHDEDNEEDNEPSYWFHFSPGGKKTTSDQKTIDGKKYYFNEYGAAQTGWVREDDKEEWNYYGEGEDCSLRTGWFEAIPHEDMDSDAHSNETSYWFYSSGSGKLTTKQIKTIGNKSYAFNEFGGMLTGLQKLKIEDKAIEAHEKIESEDDLPTGDGEWGVYYMNEENGEIRTGSQNVDVGGENYTYYFKTSGTTKGRGVHGIDGNYVYDNGKRLKADSGTKYQAVKFDKDSEDEYLVNTSGVLAKKRTNITDSDGIYYCTDSTGKITYSGSEKQEK